MENHFSLENILRGKNGHEIVRRYALGGQTRHEHVLGVAFEGAKDKEEGRVFCSVSITQLYCVLPHTQRYKN